MSPSQQQGTEALWVPGPVKPCARTPGSLTPCHAHVHPGARLLGSSGARLLPLPCTSQPAAGLPVGKPGLGFRYNYPSPRTEGRGAAWGEGRGPPPTIENSSEEGSEGGPRGRRSAGQKTAGANGPAARMRREDEAGLPALLFGRGPWAALTPTRSSPCPAEPRALRNTHRSSLEWTCASAGVSGTHPVGLPALSPPFAGTPQGFHSLASVSVVLVHSQNEMATHPRAGSPGSASPRRRLAPSPVTATARPG